MLKTKDHCIFFLALMCVHPTKGIILTQSKYAESLLIRSCIQICKATTTPMSPTKRLSSAEGQPMQEYQAM